LKSVEEAFAWHSHRKTCWSQSRRWICLIIMGKPAEVSEGDGCVSTDFTRFFHDYVKHTSLQLTSAGFAMTMSSKHLFNWLQQVFPSWKNLVKSVEAMGVFDIVMEKPAEVSWRGVCLK
jgi:succinylglutamate desuccinylase